MGVSPLDTTDVEILTLVAQGHRNRDIARRLGPPATSSSVSCRITTLCNRTGCTDALPLVLLCLREGWIDVDGIGRVEPFEALINRAIAVLERMEAQLPATPAQRRFLIAFDEWVRGRNRDKPVLDRRQQYLLRQLTLEPRLQGPSGGRVA